MAAYAVSAVALADLDPARVRTKACSRRRTRQPLSALPTGRGLGSEAPRESKAPPLSRGYAPHSGAGPPACRGANVTVSRPLGSRAAGDPLLTSVDSSESAPRFPPPPPPSLRTGTIKAATESDCSESLQVPAPESCSATASHHSPR